MSDDLQLEQLERQLRTLRDEIETLRDYEEIRQVMYAYARGVDRADQDLIAPTFHDDAYDDHGNFKGDKASTLAALKKSSQVASTTASFHHIGNILIDLHGDTAQVESYFLAVQRRENSGKAFTRTRAGRYLDQFRKRDGHWRVIHRQVVDDWSRLDEVVAVAAEVGPDNHLGRRDPQDPSYAMEGFVSGRKRKTEL